MEGKRRKGMAEDSLVVEDGKLVEFPSVPFATCLLHLQLLLQVSFHQEEVKQPHCTMLLDQLWDCTVSG